MKDAFEKAGRLQEIFGRDNLFVEIQDQGIPEQHRTNPMLYDLARRIQAPLLATLVWRLSQKTRICFSLNGMVAAYKPDSVCS